MDFQEQPGEKKRFILVNNRRVGIRFPVFMSYVSYWHRILLQKAQLGTIATLKIALHFSQSAVKE